jgi:hypothetical protein
MSAFHIVNNTYIFHRHIIDDNTLLSKCQYWASNKTHFKLILKNELVIQNLRLMLPSTSLLLSLLSLTFPIQSQTVSEKTIGMKEAETSMTEAL